MSAVRLASTAASGGAQNPSLDSRKYIPRRACLYIPGNDEAKIRKIPKMNVDSVILDCEDGVALNRKTEARATIAKMLDEVTFGRTEPSVRVNSIASGLTEDDLHAVMQAMALPPTILLPKVDDPSHIQWFAEKFLSILQERKVKKKKFNLVIYVESALGMLNLPDICRKANEITELGAPLQLDGIVFGSDDFLANIGAERTKDAKELLYARQKLVLVAKAFHLHAIDLVHIDFKDTEGLREQSLEGARMGFTGKQVIHPIQIPIVQEAFSPNPKKVEWATELIKAFDEHQKSGEGAFTFRGNMIDMPSLLQAKNIVQLQQLIVSSAVPADAPKPDAPKPEPAKSDPPPSQPEPKQKSSAAQ